MGFLGVGCGKDEFSRRYTFCSGDIYDEDGNGISRKISEFKRLKDEFIRKISADFSNYGCWCWKIQMKNFRSMTEGDLLVIEVGLLSVSVRKGKVK